MVKCWSRWFEIKNCTENSSRSCVESTKVTKVMRVMKLENRILNPLVSYRLSLIITFVYPLII